MVWRHGAPSRNLPRIDQSVMEFGDGAIPKSERPALTLDDRCLYIYTSGTTGLPKAAHINHYRVYAAMLAFSRGHGGDRERPHLQLPADVPHLRRRARHRLGAGRRRLGLYPREILGERTSGTTWSTTTARASSISASSAAISSTRRRTRRSSQHAIRIACGNGLRPDIWQPFKERFGIEHIREFYAATEGNAILFNFDDTPGAVGRIPRWARPIFPVTNIRFDIERETPVRGDDGLCIECDVGEVGELISQIVINPLKPGQRFDGYADKVETEKKILRDVFVAGDMWFRSGDLMRRDERGYFYFIDRIGDTFRWKGENVSTSEVAEALGACPGVAEVNVYGIAIAGADGRAGMATIVPAEGFDLADAPQPHARRCCRQHARPLFVRFSAELDATSTFKQRKLDLVRAGLRPLGHPRPDLLRRSRRRPLRPHRRRALRPPQFGRDPPVTALTDRGLAGR